MGLDLKPVQYLGMLNEEYREYKKNPLSMRKVITCCALSNAMPEIIFAEYGSTEPQKVHGAKDHGGYRERLRRECEAHHTVRDICDFSKHGPELDRPSVSVQHTRHTILQEGVFRALLALTQIQEVGRLVVTFQDGRKELMDEILVQVINSWDVIFKRDRL
jgi:hypothetical protein